MSGFSHHQLDVLQTQQLAFLYKYAWQDGERNSDGIHNEVLFPLLTAVKSETRQEQDSRPGSLLLFVILFSHFFGIGKRNDTR